MSKNPFFNALGAAVYILVLVFVISSFSGVDTPDEGNILVPVTMLSLFVLSAAVMGFFFLSEPFKLYFDNKKKEAANFFFQTVGYFAGFAVLFLILNLLTR